MSLALLIAAVLPLLAWLYLLLFHGGFWRGRERLDGAPGTRADWPAVVAIVPARNEADVIGQAMASLLRQDYPGALTVILVDDDEYKLAKFRGLNERTCQSHIPRVVEGDTVEAGLAALDRLSPGHGVTASGSPFPFPPDLDEAPLRAHVPEYPTVSVRDGVEATFRAFAELNEQGRLPPLPK